MKKYIVLTILIISCIWIHYYSIDVCETQDYRISLINTNNTFNREEIFKLELEDSIKNKDKIDSLKIEIKEDEENENEFLYAYILWFSVNPKKIGIGSLIINEIIEVLKHLTNIEFIIIHPKDKEVKKFWIKNKFIEDQKLNSDKRININTRRILSYQI